MKRNNAKQNKIYKKLIYKKLKSIFSFKVLANALAGRIYLKAISLAIASFTISAAYCVTTVSDYELVMFYRFGALKRSAVKPGLNWFFPVIDSVYRFDVRTKSILVEDPILYDEKDISGIRIKTRDGWSIGAVTSIYYSIDKEKGYELITVYGASDSEEARKQMEQRIEDEFRYAIQTLAPQYTLDYMISNRSELIANVQYILGLSNSFDTGAQIGEQGSTSLVQKPAPLIGEDQPGKRLSDLGLIIEYIKIDLDLPVEYMAQEEEYASLVRDRKLEEEKQEYLVLKKKTLSQENEISKVEATGEAEAIQITGEAKADLPPHIFYVDKWNGQLPETVILNEDISTYLTP